jgi:hypothetical protein
MSRVARTVLTAFAASVAFIFVIGLNADFVRQTFFPVEFTFGKAEMMDTLAHVNQTRTWSFMCGQKRCAVDLALSPTPGIDTIRRLTQQRGPLTSVAHACESRSFFQTASACYDTTMLAVQGTVEIREHPVNVVLLRSEANGELTARGTSLGRTTLMLRVPGGALEMYSRDAKLFELQTLWVRATQPEVPEIKFSR